MKISGLVLGNRAKDGSATESGSPKAVFSTIPDVMIVCLVGKGLHLEKVE